MKALIISDIHSNIYALEAIWSEEKDCDVIYLLENGRVAAIGTYNYLLETNAYFRRMTRN